MKNQNSDNNSKAFTAAGLFLILILIVFITDIFTNAVTNAFNLPIIPESILDGILIILLAFPSLYIFIFRPLSREIVQRGEAAKELRYAKEQAELLFRITPSAILTFDKEMRITSWNDKAAEITGYSSEDVLGKTCSVFTGLPCGEECDSYDHAPVPSMGRECHIKTKDGRILTILKNTDYVNDPRGNVAGVIESFEDITIRKRFEEALRESRDYFNEIINSVADPIFVKDRQHRWILINNAYSSFVGRHKEEMLGKTNYDLFPKEEANLSAEKDELVFKTGKENLSEEEFTGSDGVVHIIATKKTLYTNNNGEQFIVGVIRDLTERKRVEKLKDEFIGTVSHEIRTPLSITKEGVNLVLDKVPGPINEQQARILTIAKNNIDRLSRIVNSLLDISKIESGKTGVKWEAFDIITVIRQVISSFELKIQEKGLALRADLPKAGLIIHADTDSITQVLTNLIGNALKFTDIGFIDVAAKDKGANIEISVSDTGIGIAEENIPKLFEKFQQFGRVSGPGEKGTGLGLAIAKGIVLMHKGRIWAESDPGKWTKITFTIPKDGRQDG